MTSFAFAGPLNVARLTRLAGTASLFALAAGVAHAQAPAAAAAAPPTAEEVTVTGSLIRGAEAVGVPVTALGAEEFVRTGAVTVADLLREIPSVSVVETVGVTQTSGGNRQRLQNSTIHGINSGTAVYALLMIEGRRYPAQGTNLQNIDPSIVAPLAVQRIDIFAAGASATYGSDAVSGVFNVVLKRGFDGATLMGRVGLSTDLGWESHTIESSAQFGRTWDNWLGLGPGDIAITYDWWEQGRVYGQARDYETPNFEPWGFDDRTFMGMNKAGIISTGSPASSLSLPATVAGGVALQASLGTRYCSNCFSVPVGTGWDFGTQAPGPAVNWATLITANKGVTTQIAPQTYSWMNPAQQNNSAVLTFDQTLTQDFYGLGPVEFFVNAFYQNRRGQNAYLPGYSPCASCVTTANGVTIPTVNPYYPTGVPAGTVVRAHFTVTPDLVPFSTNYIIDRQMQFGFNFQSLPFDWNGSVFGSISETHANDHNNGVNVNMLNAALGNTIASQAAVGVLPARAAYVKPATLPFLNPFCDRALFQCDSQATLDYITSDRVDNSVYNEREYGATFNGPIFDLPGGTLRAAVGVGVLSQVFNVYNDTNEATFNKEILSHSYQFNKYTSQSITGQLNVPIIGADMGIPLVESLVLDLGYRFDHYDQFGWVRTPKIGGNWTVGYGFSFRGAYGTSFTAPGFGNLTDYQFVRSTNEMYNVPNARSVTLNLNCPGVSALGIVGGTVAPNTLQAALNPGRVGCPAGGGLAAGPADTGTLGNFNSITAPVGLQLNLSLDYLQGKTLEPETSKQWSLGFGWAPKQDDPIFGFLNGLTVDAEYWHIKLENVIGTLTVGTAGAPGVNDPNALDRSQPIGTQTTDQRATRFIVAPRPDLQNTAPENAAFKAFIDEIVGLGKCNCDTTALQFIKFIETSGIANRGWLEKGGIDATFRYDFDLGGFGTISQSAAFSYLTRDRQRTNALTAIVDKYTAKNRGTGVLTGQDSGHQLQSARFTTVWTDMGGHWSVAPVFDWRPHKFTTATPPACFWHPDFGPAHPDKTPYGGLCYQGAPYWQQDVQTFKAGTAAALSNADQKWEGLYHPSQVFVNLSVSYTFYDEPENDYLKNLRLALNVNNLFNRYGSDITYDPRTTSGSARIREGNDFQRVVTFTITKTW